LRVALIGNLRQLEGLDCPQLLAQREARLQSFGRFKDG
jgi:hypothetical protein